MPCCCFVGLLPQRASVRGCLDVLRCTAAFRAAVWVYKVLCSVCMAQLCYTSYMASYTPGRPLADCPPDRCSLHRRASWLVGAGHQPGGHSAGEGVVLLAEGVQALAEAQVSGRAHQ